MRVFIYDSTGLELVSTAERSFRPIPPLASDIASAREGVIVTNPRPDLIAALVQLRMLNDAYLMVVRVVDPRGAQLLHAQS